MIRRLGLVGLVLTGMGLGLVHAPTPDAAAPLAPAGQHCVVNIDPVQPGAQTSRVEEGGCFATLAEALAVATDGAARVDPQMQPHELTKERFPTAGRTVIAIDYADANFRGDYILWSVSQGGCAPGVHFRASSMPDGWNDRVSSVLGGANCDLQFLFEHIDFNSHTQGEVAECHPECEGLRVMDNKTSSRFMAD
jgi:hypothetical protein